MPITNQEMSLTGMNCYTIQRRKTKPTKYYEHKSYFVLFAEVSSSEGEEASFQHRSALEGCRVVFPTEYCAMRHDAARWILNVLYLSRN